MSRAGLLDEVEDQAYQVEIAIRVIMLLPAMFQQADGSGDHSRGEFNEIRIGIGWGFQECHGYHGFQCPSVLRFGDQEPRGFY